MLIRTISAIIGMLILGYGINTGGWFFYIGITVLNLCAIYELYNALQKADIHINFILNSVFAVVLLYFVNFSYKFDFILVYYSIVLILILTFLFSLINNFHSRLSDAVFSVFSFVYTALLFMSIILTRNLPNGTNLTWWIFVTIWACDTGAFFAGIWWGRTPLAPNISPKKTLEGSLGGILLSVIVCTIFKIYFLPEISNLYAVILGFLIAFASQAGDLSASLIKRYCKIKDFSNIIPGHGGILDRLDSALFSFPVAYIYIILLLQKGGLQ
ncbi:phosphatidate cytidylyltransferase [Tepidanaerobacter acetatoxydans]|uniref:phosphatidate cytidylyltransferase n=1 Tax=Tepidanaerobacter acetatoxydans TaxID=499229 RepID=UPI00235B6EEC|nr:phosphatidate cytidylyltransferase [Tepidanaerobacter acetatoxydans]